MSNASPYELDKWQRYTTYYYRHVETGRIIHEEAYEARKRKHKTLTNADVTANKEIRELIEEWRERGHDPYGMSWLKPADELEELIDE